MITTLIPILLVEILNFFVLLVKVSIFVATQAQYNKIPNNCKQFIKVLISMSASVLDP